MSRLCIGLTALLFSIAAQAFPAGHSIMILATSVSDVQLRSDGSAVIPYTLTNNTASTPLTNIMIDYGYSQGNSGNMSTINNTCAGITLVPAATCTFQVYLQGGAQPDQFMLSPRACVNNVCSQATIANRPQVTVIPITHPVRAYFGLLDRSTPNPKNNTLQPVNIATHALSPTADGFNFYFTAFNLPVGTCISPDGNTLYITNTGDVGPNANKLSIVDVSADTPVLTNYVSVGNTPTSVVISPDGSTVYVTNFDFSVGNIAVMDTSTLAITNINIPSAIPLALALSPDGSILYVSNVGGNEVFMIDTSTNTLNPTPITGFNTPEFLAISPDGSQLYVPNYFGNNVTVINTSDPYGAPLATITTGNNPTVSIVSPDGSKAFVTSTGAPYEISVIDTTTLTVTQTIPLSTAPGGLSFTPDASQLYVGPGAGTLLQIINMNNYSDIQTVDIGDSSTTIGHYIG